MPPLGKTTTSSSSAAAGAGSPLRKASTASLLRLPSDDTTGNSSSNNPHLESTIVSRENATHLAYAASRKHDFVYAATAHYLRILHDYCTVERDPTGGGNGSGGSSSSSLLVVLGQPGTLGCLSATYSMRLGLY